jgi:flagellar protein FlaF
MYQQLYEEVAEEATNKIRDDERRAFRHSIALLNEAKKSGPGTKEAVEALFFLNRLWGVLLEDLASPENALPRDLKAKLISIGIWILRHAEDIRTGKKQDFQALIDVSESISMGLTVQR